MVFNSAGQLTMSLGSVRKSILKLKKKNCAKEEKNKQYLKKPEKKKKKDHKVYLIYLIIYIRSTNIL